MQGPCYFLRHLTFRVEVGHRHTALKVLIKEEPVGQTQTDCKRAHDHVEGVGDTVGIGELVIENVSLFLVEQEGGNGQRDVAEHEGY